MSHFPISDRLRAAANYGSNDYVKLMREAADGFERLCIALNGLRRSHFICDDCWYSCPKSGESCNEEPKDKCTCGGDEHNAKIDVALQTGAPASLMPIYGATEDPAGRDIISAAVRAVKPRKVVGRVTGKLLDGDQVPGMPHAICHACGLKDYPCSNPDCPNKAPTEDQGPDVLGEPK